MDEHARENVFDSDTYAKGVFLVNRKWMVGFSSVTGFLIYGLTHVDTVEAILDFRQR